MIRTPWSAAKALVVGGLAVGILDGLDAIIFFGLRSGATPQGIFRGIAGGLVGRPAARAGGIGMALVGVLCHFFIAFSIVTVYYVVSRRLHVLAQHPFIFGPLYGIAAYLVMNQVVIPLSALGAGPAPPWPVFINGLTIHALGVGLPSALVAWRALGSVRE
jgi:hypothetical protein